MLTDAFAIIQRISGGTSNDLLHDLLHRSERPNRFASRSSRGRLCQLNIDSPISRSPPVTSCCIRLWPCVGPDPFPELLFFWRKLLNGGSNRIGIAKRNDCRAYFFQLNFQKWPMNRFPGILRRSDFSTVVYSYPTVLAPKKKTYHHTRSEFPFPRFGDNMGALFDPSTLLTLNGEISPPSVAPRGHR